MEENKLDSVQIPEQPAGQTQEETPPLQEGQDQQSGAAGENDALEETKEDGGEQSPVIRFDNRMDREDYRELLYFNIFSRKRWVYWSSIGLAALCAFVVIQTVMGRGAIDMLFWVSLVYLVLVAVLFLQINAVSKRFAQQEGASAERPFTVDANGIHSPNADGTEGSVAWESLLDGYETFGYFLFYVNPRQALVFTKKSIGTEQGVVGIRALAMEKMGKRFDIRMKKRR